MAAKEAKTQPKERRKPEITREKRMETIALSVRAGVLMLRFPASSMESSRSEVTELLQLWSDGRKEALDRLLPHIYAELRRLASTA